MATSDNDGDKRPTPPDTSTVILLLGTIGDTTWRLFVPTIGLTILGLWADKQIGSSPWLLTLGIITGSAIAVLLVRAQMKKRL